MNLGQFLSSKSPLPTGTVAQHLAAIYASSGNGDGQTIFSSRFNVVTGVERIEVTRKARRHAPDAVTALRVQPPQSSNPKTAYAIISTPSLSVRTERDEIIVTTKQQSAVAAQHFESATIIRKRKTT